MRPSATAVLLLLGAVCAGCLSSAPHTGLPDTVTYDAIRFDTDAGPITAILYNASAPKTVALLHAYVNESYYDGRSFGRIVPSHVIQVTDAAGGATDDKRTVPLEAPAGFHFSAGAAGIARGADPDSGGPEIFLMDFATSHLDGNYTVWGQVVDGLPAIHAIARGPALDFRMLPPALGPAEPTDRFALHPVQIQATTLGRVTEPAGIYPLNVAKDARSGDFRHSLEWPHTLQAGRAADLTWYVRTYNGTAPPDPARTQVRIGAQTLLVHGEAGVAGIYHFRWTPTDLSPVAATLWADGVPVGSLRIVP